MTWPLYYYEDQSLEGGHLGKDGWAGQSWRHWQLGALCYLKRGQPVGVRAAQVQPQTRCGVRKAHHHVSLERLHHVAERSQGWAGQSSRLQKEGKWKHKNGTEVYVTGFNKK